jgi:hypothetical protein
MAEWMAEGIRRAAEAALRTHGGCAVVLRLAAPAAQGDDAEQLGLATPQFNDVALGPACFYAAGSAHKANNVKRLVIAAQAVETLCGTLGFDAVDVLFETAIGVLIDGLLYEITDNTSSQANGRAYCYWLTLERPVR